MAPVYAVMSFFVLSLLIPFTLASWRVWRRASVPRQVTCPLAGQSAVVECDPWYAVKMHALGNQELRVLECSCARGTCGQECLEPLRHRI